MSTGSLRSRFVSPKLGLKSKEKMASMHRPSSVINCLFFWAGLELVILLVILVILVSSRRCYKRNRSEDDFALFKEGARSHSVVVQGLF